MQTCVGSNIPCIRWQCTLALCGKYNGLMCVAVAVQPVATVTEASSFFYFICNCFCDFLVFAPRALFDWIFDFVAVYFVCSYISCAFPLVLFPSLFLNYLFRYLYFPLRIDPLCFQAGRCKRQLNLALVFLCLFCVVVHFF